MAWESIIKRKELPAPKNSGVKDRVLSDFEVPTLRDRLGPYEKKVPGIEIFEALHERLVSIITFIILEENKYKISPELKEIKREIKELQELFENFY